MLRVALFVTVFLLLLVDPALSPLVWIVGLIWVGFLFCRDLVQSGFWPSVLFVYVILLSWRLPQSQPTAVEDLSLLLILAFRQRTRWILRTAIGLFALASLPPNVDFVGLCVLVVDALVTAVGTFRNDRQTQGECCVEAECHFCYLRDSGLYVHESCCPGNQHHLPTYVGYRRFWYGPLTKYGS
jgi:hypothetical protein